MIRVAGDADIVEVHLEKETNPTEDESKISHLRILKLLVC